MKSRYPWLVGALADGGVVITANRRLARELRGVYGEIQIATGKKAWPTPDIQFVTDWLEHLYESGPLDKPMPLRIDSQASTVLWERCVESTLCEPLPGLSGIASQCKQAWIRLQDWRIPLHEAISRSSGAEQKQFAAAVQQYRQTLSRNSWIDDAGLIEAVIQQVSVSSLDLPTRIYMAGFDRTSPVLELLLEKLANQEVEITHAEFGCIAETILTSTHRDPASELRAAGAWARNQLIENPAARLAIICPDLDSNAFQVARLVREGFAPGWQISGSDHRNAVNISYGKPLADYPSVRVALMLLRWVHDGLNSREVSVLLRSRSIAGGSTGGRSRLEQKLRRLPDRHWVPEDLLGALKTALPDADVDSWSQSIGKIAAAKLHYREKAGPAQWAERFDRLLTDAGWPGSETLDSHEFQLLNRWRDLLNEFARLDRVVAAMSFRSAVARLASLASDTVFQPESDRAVLPVLGTLEAAGMEFDCIWVTSFDTRHWPASGSPLAYVSRQLQKEHGMPDSTPQDTLVFSRRVIERLLHSATNVVLSWALSEGDLPLWPSPLLQEIAVTDHTVEADPGWYASSMLNSERVITITEDPVPPVGSNEQISGGAYTVQRQASDPFSAFAYGRLRVNNLESFQTGLSARIRGNAIHTALSDLYSEHPALSELLNWSDGDWNRNISKASSRSLLRYERHADPSLRRMIQLEQRRIENILLRFAAEEQSRENFRVVMTEQELEYAGHGIRLKLRVDRVDRLDDKTVLIIDYKTGAEKALLNRAGELYDLQLMVYALAIQEENSIGGIAIINLDTRKISFKDAGHGEVWQERLSRWSAEANIVVQAISRGDARVNMNQATDQARPLNILSRFEELRRE